MRAPPRRALLRAAACAALAACVSAAEPALERWALGQTPAFGLATETVRREAATAQGGRGLVTETTHGVDVAPTEMHAHESAGSASGDVARDVRSRPEPRVRDARLDAEARILSLSRGLPREAREAVERALALARSASEVQLILDDLADAAVDALRDEAYWRGAAGTAAAADDPPPPPASSSSSSPGSDFRAFGPFSPRRERVTFYWPPLGFDLAERVTPWVSAVVYTPEAPNSPNGSGRFPAVAFAVGWNSWVERYDATLRQLASHGFIVIAPTVADRRARPLFSFTLLSKHLLASLAWLVRENSRRNSERFFEKVDIEKLGLLGHSSGAGAAVRAAVDAKVRTFGARVDGSVARESDGISGWDADTDTAHAFVSVGIRAVAGLGAFLDSSGLDLDALAHMRGVALFQLAGRLDSHVAPRAVADIAAAAVHAAPRAVGVLRHGTHCFLDEATQYEYPDSQCAAASRGEARVSLADRRDAAATGGSSNASASLFFMSPAAQLEATREYVAAFFVAELRGGGDDFGDDFVSDARERASAAAARWKMWGVEGDDGRKRRASTHSSLAAGGAGGWGNVDETDQPRSSRSRSLSLRAASPVERTGTESFGDPPPVDVTLAEDPRMSRVEVLAWA